MSADEVMDAYPEPEEVEDVVCEHGVAMDVHCCNCHSGFIFDRHHECPQEPPRTLYPAHRRVLKGV